MPAGPLCSPSCGVLAVPCGTSVAFFYSLQALKAGEHYHCTGTPVAHYSVERFLFKWGLSVGSSENWLMQRVCVALSSLSRNYCEAIFSTPHDLGKECLQGFCRLCSLSFWWTTWTFTTLARTGKHSSDFHLETVQFTAGQVT